VSADERTRQFGRWFAPVWAVGPRPAEKIKFMRGRKKKNGSEEIADLKGNDNQG
jgi:hypothetical protein